jgi:carboxylate-amine ligase
MAGDFTFGIEEKYFLVDARTKLAVRSMPETFFKAAEVATDGRISREFLQAQIEVISSPRPH